MKNKTRMRRFVSIFLLLSFLSACASSPDKISPSYVSPLQYQGYTCNQIGQELIRVNNRILQVTGHQRKEADKDAAAMGVGLVLFWPALFFLAGDDKKEELASLKGEYEALEKIAIQKECNIATELKEARKQREKYEDERKKKSVSDTMQDEELMQESDKPAIEIKSAGNAEHIAAQIDRLKSFLFFYCQTYESKDLDKFAALFTPDALENNRPFHLLLPQYRRNMDMIESFNYRIELNTYSLSTDSNDIKVKGKYFSRFMYEGTLKENSGNISMELVENGDSYLVKQLNYTSRSGKKGDKQSQWGPWIETENKE